MTTDNTKKSVGFKIDRDLLKIWLKRCIDKDVKSGPEIVRLIKEELKRGGYKTET